MNIRIKIITKIVVPNSFNIRQQLFVLAEIIRELDEYGICYQ
jgi:hypothetical protein